MFRKLVSNLPFSPALVGQLGFYARRLNSEQAIRRLGLVFTVLALAVQALAIVKPPEQTIAASPTNACVFDSSLAKDDTNCQACPYNSTIWVKDTSCAPSIHLSNEAFNLSQNSKIASKTTAQPEDRIQYNLQTSNNGASDTTADVQIKVADLLEYASIIDLGGGSYDANTKTISWGAVSLKSGQTDTRSFVIEINSVISATPQAIDNPESYDCTLTNVYGNTLNTHLSCPIGKTVESTVRQLPTIGMGIVVIMSTLIFVTTLFYYARSKQLNRELRVVKHEFNVGPTA